METIGVILAWFALLLGESVRDKNPAPSDHPWPDSWPKRLRPLPRHRRTRSSRLGGHPVQRLGHPPAEHDRPGRRARRTIPHAWQPRRSCRLRRHPGAERTGAASTTRLGHCGMWSRTTCCRCLPWWRWTRRWGRALCTGLVRRLWGHGGGGAGLDDGDVRRAAHGDRQLPVGRSSYAPVRSWQSTSPSSG
jgi:hypothetical protein